jgi:hypothetical protein
VRRNHAATRDARRRWSWSLLAAAVLLAGCTLGPPIAVTPGASARPRRRRGDHAGAAHLA